jgi:hypothetical protein
MIKLNKPNIDKILPSGWRYIKWTDGPIKCFIQMPNEFKENKIPKEYIYPHAIYDDGHSTETIVNEWWQRNKQ